MYLYMSLGINTYRKYVCLLEIKQHRKSKGREKKKIVTQGDYYPESQYCEDV